MPLPYRHVALVRCGLLLSLTAIFEGGAIFVLARAWPWALSKDGGAWLLAWLPTLFWLAGWGALLAFCLRSRAASAAILGVIWVIELAFRGAGIFLQYAWTTPLYVFATMFSPDAPFWLFNRLELLGTGILLFIAVWLYLSNAHRQL